MPAENQTFATISRFVSIVVLSCLVITGGMWFYQNRAEIAGGESNKDGSTWFTRWAGVDHTKLKEHPAGIEFSESPFKTEFAIDPDWIKNLHGGAVEFDWDR
jgi:hypothetical protein